MHKGDFKEEGHSECVADDGEHISCIRGILRGRGTVGVWLMMVNTFHNNNSTMCDCLERDVAQWLERGALSMSLPAVRFRIPLGAGFSEKYHVSPLSILGHYFDVASLGKTLHPHMLHLIQV